jgi:hypothetical protein
MYQGEIMASRRETPFESIEGALEYVGYLLEASEEAQRHVVTEITGASDPRFARKKQALELVHYKLDKLNFHIAKSQSLLKDLRKLRRLILQERATSVSAATA